MIFPGCFPARQIFVLVLIQAQVYNAAPTFLGLAAIPFIGQKPRQCAQQKGTKTATEPISLFESRMFQEVKHKFLRQIVRFTFRITAPANELAQRRPIAAAQFLQSLPRRGFIIQRGSGKQTPMCCRKVHPVFLTKQIRVRKRPRRQFFAIRCASSLAEIVPGFKQVTREGANWPVLRSSAERVNFSKRATAEDGRSPLDSVPRLLPRAAALWPLPPTAHGFWTEGQRPMPNARRGEVWQQPPSLF